MKQVTINECNNIAAAYEQLSLAFAAVDNPDYQGLSSQSEKYAQKAKFWRRRATALKVQDSQQPEQ